MAPDGEPERPWDVPVASSLLLSLAQPLKGLHDLCPKEVVLLEVDEQLDGVAALRWN